MKISKLQMLNFMAVCCVLGLVIAGRIAFIFGRNYESEEEYYEKA